MKRQAPLVHQLLMQKTLLRPNDAVSSGYSRMYLTQLAKRGELRKVGRGLYASPLRKESEESGLAEVAIKHPRAVVCLLSALAVHGLTTQTPHEVWVAVGSKDRAPKMDYPPLRIVRFGGETLSEGSEVKLIEEIPVQITNLPKTIADCFKFRNKIGLDVALEALKEAWWEKRVSIDDLWRYARLCRVQNVMRPYLESLVT
ncbi:MAG: type IV toxin-antitoxin system AbiEi family antitoxin domain-containing protein [Fluviibacter sp.]